MPLYAYTCTRCGPFDEMRPVEEAGLEAPCPVCRAPALRSFTAPAILASAAARRAALAPREEPRVVRRAVGQERGGISGGDGTSGAGASPAPLRRQAGGAPWALGL